MVKLDSVEESAALFSQMYETYVGPMELEWARQTNPFSFFNLCVPGWTIPLHYYSRKALHHKCSIRRRKLKTSDCLNISSETRRGAEFFGDRFVLKGEWVVTPDYDVFRAEKNNVRLVFIFFFSSF